MRENVLRANEGRFAIFTFAIGSSAPFKDLEKLSVQNNGVARQIFTNSDVKDFVEDFYKSVAVPLLWNMQIDYRNAKKSIMSGKKLFRGEEVVVVGELEDPCRSPEPTVLAESEDADFNDVTVLNEIDCSTLIPVILPSNGTDVMANPTGLPSDINLERMFAYLQIRRWLTAIKGATNQSETDQLEQEITDQAVKHGFVTKFTSMVVKETNDDPVTTPIPVEIPMFDAAPLSNPIKIQSAGRHYSSSRKMSAPRLGRISGSNIPRHHYSPSSSSSSQSMSMPISQPRIAMSVPKMSMPQIQRRIPLQMAKPMWTPTRSPIRRTTTGRTTRPHTSTMQFTSTSTTTTTITTTSTTTTTTTTTTNGSAAIGPFVIDLQNNFTTHLEEAVLYTVGLGLVHPRYSSGISGLKFVMKGLSYFLYQTNSTNQQLEISKSEA